MGVYEVFERISEAFPHILFESCSGGGGRFDLGMLYFSPQVRFDLGVLCSSPPVIMGML